MNQRLLCLAIPVSWLSQLPARGFESFELPFDDSGSAEAYRFESALAEGTGTSKLVSLPFAHLRSLVLSHYVRNQKIEMEMEGGIESISRVVAAGERKGGYLGLEVKQLARYLRASWVQVEGKLMVLHLHSWVQAAY